MSHDHFFLSVGVDDLFGPWPGSPQAVPYDRHSHKLHHTRLRVTASRSAFFYNPLTELGRHLLHIPPIQRQFVGNLLVGYIQSHEVETQHPDFQWLMMTRK